MDRLKKGKKAYTTTLKNHQKNKKNMKKASSFSKG